MFFIHPLLHLLRPTPTRSQPRSRIFLLIYANMFGRPFWHSPRKLVDFEMDGPGTSKQVFDIYSFSHITHGVLLYFLLKPLNLSKKIYVALFIEVLWEIFENTPYIINKYRRRKEYENYDGDSIVNIVGDCLCALLGYLICAYSESAGVVLAIVLEVILIPYGANFLRVGIGALMM